MKPHMQRPREPKRGPPHFRLVPRQDAPPICFAVHCTANTPKRLAIAWDISVTEAEGRLIHAAKAGIIAYDPKHHSAYRLNGGKRGVSEWVSV